MTGKSAHTFFRLSSVLATGFVVVACGGAANETKAPSQMPATPGASQDSEEPQPRSVDEALDQIARARANLDDGDKKKADDKAQPKPAEPRAESPPQGGATSGPAREEATIVNVCGNRCRALASMKRAVEALCRMTGDADNRCVDAKRTLDQSAAHVSSCKCE